MRNLIITTTQFSFSLCKTWKLKIMLILCTFSAGTMGTNYSSVTMLSATSLLHNSHIFNRNNTVATQQGMKTYWLWWILTYDYFICTLHIKHLIKKEATVLYCEPFLIPTPFPPHPLSRSYRLTTCRARCITASGRILSTTGQHNHAPHVKNSSATVTTKPDLAVEQQQQQSGGFIQPQQQHQQQQMTNQNSNMPMPSATSSGLMNQHQMSANINFGALSSSSSSSVAAVDENVSANINFSMSNILNVAQLTDIDASALLHSSTQLNSDVQINPVLVANSSINNMQIHHHANQNVHTGNGGGSNAESFNLTVASTNNWRLSRSMNDNAKLRNIWIQSYLLYSDTK